MTSKTAGYAGKGVRVLSHQTYVNVVREAVLAHVEVRIVVGQREVSASALPMHGGHFTTVAFANSVLSGSLNARKG